MGKYIMVSDNVWEFILKSRWIQGSDIFPPSAGLAGKAHHQAPACICDFFGLIVLLGLGGLYAKR